MKPVVVHIGHPKTGSSAIQHHLRINREQLAEIGYPYPVTEALLNAKSKVSSGNGRLFLTYDGPPQPVIFSNELLFEAANFEVGSVFHRQLMTYRDHVRVIIFTRDLFDHFLSSWGQFIKRSGATDTADEFAQRYYQYSHLQNVVRFLEAQGIEVVLRNYSRMQNAVVTFMQVVLGDRAGTYLASAEHDETVINRSLAPAEAELQRRLNVHFAGAPAGRIGDWFVDLLPDISPQRLGLSQTAVDRLLEVSTHGIAYLNERLPEGEDIRMDFPACDVADAGPTQDEFGFSARQLDVIARFCYALSEQGRDGEDP